MKKNIWNFAVAFICIFSMLALVGWYTFEQVTNQMIIKGILDTVSKKNDVELILEKNPTKKVITPSVNDVNIRRAPKTIPEVLERIPELPSPDYQMVKKQVEERVKETEALKQVASSDSKKPVETKGKKKIVLTSEKIAEIESKIAIEDRMAAYRILTSSSGYNAALAAYQAGDSNKARKILSENLTQAQKSELWGYYNKYEYLLYE